MLNQNQAPYYNDFDATRNYLQSVFVPGRAIQGRELTQIQSALQYQISSGNNHLFSNGSAIVGASVNVNFDAFNTVVTGNTVDEVWVGRKFIGEDSGGTFEVIAVNVSENRIYFAYRGGNLQDNEACDIHKVADQASLTSIPFNITTVGKGVIAESDEGIIYMNGLFVVVPSQTLIVDSVDTNDHIIGYQYTDSFVTEAEDASLRSPAQGSPNYNAPGAHRYKVEAVLTSHTPVEDAPKDFYYFVQASGRNIISSKNEVRYGDILNMLAARTHDESGNYTVDPFLATLDSDPDNDNKLRLGIEPGEGYVNGFNHETIATQILSFDKARTFAKENNAQLYSTFGSFFIASTIDSVFDVAKREEVFLWSKTAGAGDKIDSEVGEKFQIFGIYRTGLVYRIYISGLNKVESLLHSVRSISTADGRYVDVDVKTLDGVTYPLFGISPSEPPVFKLPHRAVKAVDNTETIYESQNSLITYSNKVGNDFVITAPDTQTNFDDSLVLIRDSDTDDDLLLTAVAVANNSGVSTLTISNVATVTNIDVIYNTFKTQAPWKTKEITSRTENFTTGASQTSYTFEKSDVYKIVSLSADGVEIPLNTIQWDDGQRDFVIEKPTLQGLTVSTEYTVVYEYFEHVGTGDYFSVDSYMIAANLALYPKMYETIPEYASEDGQLTYDLRDCLDFRRKAEDVTTGVEIVIPESVFIVDYDYYMGRIDKLYLTADGVFGIQKGVPMEEPDAPNDVPGTMTLYRFTVPPYTISPEDVEMEQIDNQRYTMRDIGTLDERISRLEINASLSLLENSVHDLSVVDVFGNEKYKNGFFVDNFTTHETSDLFHEEYDCAIDTEEQEMRPSFAVESAELVPQWNALDPATSNPDADLQLNENTISLAYTEVTLIDQPKASETMNVNPFSVYVWAGGINLIPKSDNWIDTKWSPAHTVHLPADTQAFRKVAGFMGTKWNSWKTYWTGTKKTNLGTKTTKYVDRSRWKKGPHGTWLTNVTKTTKKFKVTKTQKQYRTGVKMSVKTRTVKRSLGEKVLDTAIIPIMRQKEITFTAEGMKPDTTLNAYFDGTLVNDKITPEGLNLGDSLVTDQAGRATGIFSLPGGVFKTGARDFVLIDDKEDSNTEAKATYTATGLLQTKQKQILSVEQPYIVYENVFQDRVIKSSSTTTKTTTQRSKPYDPIAQSFFIDEEGGVFISSVEVYFKTKDTNIPVSLEIVSNETGLPTIYTLPFAKTTLYPENITTSTDSSVPTKFTFTDPVYLEHLGDYSFVLKSNSNNYECWIASVGGVDVLTDTGITEQPYIGSLFKSQNAFTWTPDQYKDIKFKINRCEFAASANLNYQAVFAQSEFALPQRVTTFMLNVDDMTVAGTSIDYKARFLTSPDEDYNDSLYSEIINKENIDLTQHEVISDNAPLRFSLDFASEKTTLSPIIARNRSSVLLIDNNVQEDAADPTFDYAGAYVSQTTTLEDPADDLRVILDAKKPAGTDIEVYYRTGVYNPKNVDSLAVEELETSLINNTCFIYEVADTTRAVTQVGSAVVTRMVEGTPDKIYLKQISDIGMFVAQADWATNSLDATNGVIITQEKELGAILDYNNTTTYNTLATTSAAGGSTYCLANGYIWKSLADDNLDNSPNENSVLWEQVPFNTLISTINTDDRQVWRRMVVEDDIDASIDPNQFIEYSYVAEEEIFAEFSQFAIKIALRGINTNATLIPKVRDLRAIALL